ncbi:N-acetylneuraminate synthase family protein [Herbaspirillum sp. NPDC101396]|jgi:N-acetylneuraminate synthase|uniref:N-acetylneuraminate synthase family protein n=1 Tax=Herbaspirillum sp. NPDC101396 TaxID=3364005 RepID=UPI00383A977D
MNNNVYIIAEVGSVHDGSFGNAQRLIDVAASCGADAVKFQTHLPAAETLKDAPMPSYFKGEPRFEYFARTGFTLEQWKKLAKHAADAGIEFMSSPFSEEAVAMLEDIGISRYKIPSGEVSNLPMLEAIAKTGKQVLLSSGMSSWNELDAAVQTILRHHDKLSVMQCTSAYPCPPERVGLNVLGEMRARWNLPVGYSDHSMENNACLAAVALGATVVEKHLTFSRAMYGSDAKHSAEPLQFAALVKGIREISAMLANPVDKNDLGDFREMKEIFEKSVVSTRLIPAGTVITADMLGIKKPGTGIPAAKIKEVIGRIVQQDVAADKLILESDLAPK